MNESILVSSKLKMSGIQDVLDLDGITEVAINEPHKIWFDRGNDWECIESETLTYLMCEEIAKSLATFAKLSEPLSPQNPIASVILPDGERGQVCIPPVTKSKHVSMTFRKPSKDRFKLDDYQNTGRLKPIVSHAKSNDGLSNDQLVVKNHFDNGEFKSFFEAAVKAKMNILLVGGTGSGKTTVMKALVDQYPKNKRLFTIEDVHELDLPYHPNHVNLFYQKGGATPKKVIEACMRMKPDHVFLAELRGNEAWSYLEALNTGHSGSITTIHANDCKSAYSRLADLVKQSEVGQTLDYEYIINVVKKSIDVIAYFEKTYLKELYFDPETKNKLLGL